ncbi:hypothetical protein MD588_04930 [Photobacterium sp. SDRW27]|uniref:hypothetical protein n=1 Tax=Photobacterium obscurum TaxID=2829490 RepID=UPI002244D5BE|nr:hypothetical protein [Photobacterium obscurum]MCW8328147.1 hypothetical protein [Photobacterium obscurum]
MKTLFAAIVVMMMSLSSSWVMANNGSGGVPGMPIYRCVLDNDGKVTEEWVPHHICQQKGGKTIF